MVDNLFLFDDSFLYEHCDCALEAMAGGIEREKTTTILKDAFYDKICTSLSKPSNQRMLFGYISEYRSRNIEQLTSPMILNNIIFNHAGEDANVVLRACGLTKEEMMPVIKETKKTLKLDQVGANITPFNICMIMAMSYFYNDVPKLKALILYYACGFYYNIYSGRFKKFGPVPEIMQYTINNATNKFKLKQYGSVEKAVIAVMERAVVFYKEQFERLYDYDICSTIITAFRTRVSQIIGSVIEEYYENYEKNNRLFTTIDKNEEGEVIIDRENNTGRIEKMASRYTIKFYSEPVNLSTIRVVKAMSTDVSENELRTAINYIHDAGSNDELKSFYQSIFSLFFKEYPEADAEDIHSRKFLASANQIYKKGNSKDPDIIKIKNISHEWLKKGSNVYRATTRAATMNSYRKCIYMYFIMLVVNK